LSAAGKKHRPEGWLAFLAEDPDHQEETEVAVYCPACAEREFGPNGPTAAERWRD
jgi:hypothetical protein